VVDQEVPVPFDVIVVTSGSDGTAEVVRRGFPQVTLVELAGTAPPGKARNAGLRLAAGEYVSFPGSHVELLPGSLAARLEAHDKGYAMVTGTTVNGNTTWAGTASYFLDHADVLPGRPSTELHRPPSHCSYRRDVLEAIGGFPEDMRAGEDTVVNHELWRRGCSAYRAMDVWLIHRSPCRTPLGLARHHFARGRAVGRIMREISRPPVRRGDSIRGVHPGYVTNRLRQTKANVRTWGDDYVNGIYRLVRPLVVVGVLAAWVGMWWELLWPRRRPRSNGVALRTRNRPIVCGLNDRNNAEGS
jgi:glycosyltransferase involved in cell wall biosynthesis